MEHTSLPVILSEAKNPGSLSLDAEDKRQPQRFFASLRMTGNGVTLYESRVFRIIRKHAFLGATSNDTTT